LRSANIQGNILFPFPKEYQAFLLIQIRSVTNAKRWIRSLLAHLTTTVHVAIDSRLKETRKPSSTKSEPCGLRCYCGISFTIDGLKLLSARRVADLEPFVAFREGAAAQSNRLGQIAENGPDKWVFGGPNQPRVDVLLTLSSPEEPSLEAEIHRQVIQSSRHGLEVIYLQRGGKLPGAMAGREHFGFKDGISQPSIAGIDDYEYVRTRGNDIKLANQLLNPGEFILGYPRGVVGNDALPLPCPSWMRDGSFQVFMRLDQDVAGWRQQLTEVSRRMSAEEPIMEQQLAAKLVGRWPSGTPLAVSPEVDSDVADQSFDYEDDPFGLKTPCFAHIRKMYPRTLATVDREWHRIIRRSIPFGPVYDPKKGPKYGADVPRGLLMNAFMSSIEDQFEFLLHAWANDPDFPEADDGPDPLVGKSSSPVTLRRHSGIKHQIKLQQYVRTSGMIYAFAPSLSLIAELYQ
jgi:Dyp-type peroxidase family